MRDLVTELLPVYKNRRYLEGCRLLGFVREPEDVALVRGDSLWQSKKRRDESIERVQRDVLYGEGSWDEWGPRFRDRKPGLNP